MVDYDELRTGMRREAQYASLAVLLPKLVPSAARAKYATYATLATALLEAGAYRGST